LFLVPAVQFSEEYALGEEVEGDVNPEGSDIDGAFSGAPSSSEILISAPIGGLSSASSKIE
jgi:hypothetical protein